MCARCSSIPYSQEMHPSSSGNVSFFIRECILLHQGVYPLFFGNLGLSLCNGNPLVAGFSRAQYVLNARIQRAKVRIFTHIPKFNSPKSYILL